MLENHTVISASGSPAWSDDRVACFTAGSFRGNRMQCRCIAAIALVCFLSLAATDAPGQSAEERTVTAGTQYDAGAVHRLFFGSLWRDTWTAPVRVPVLDLEHDAGGLTPLRRGGGFQTNSLRLRGGDGREYKFRSIEKDPSKVLAPELRNTFVADVLQDLISTANPYGALVTAPILEAAEILQAEPRLVIMPDSPLLGDYRAEFANSLGMIEIHPNESDDEDAAFAGSDKVVGTFSLLDKLQKHTDDRVHAVSYLKARLLDIFMGDWDRHTDQWRWARYEDGAIDWWYPIPRDRDQAFCRYDGLIPWLATFAVPQIESCDASYPQLQYLTYSGRHLDRRILSCLPWPVYDSLLNVLLPVLNDSLLASAVTRLPGGATPDGNRILLAAGDELLSVLKSRRDRLTDAAHAYYDVLTEETDIHCSDEDEQVIVRRDMNGDVSVTARSLQPGKHSETEAVFFERTFHRDETREIRIYLEGGDDVCILQGTSPEGIVIRVVGGKGEDRIIDSSLVESPLLGFLPFDVPSKANLVYDAGDGTELRRGVSTVVDRTASPKPRTPQERYEPALRDWGAEWLPGLMGAWDADLGILFGGGAVYTRYGFRCDPYAYRIRMNAGLAPLEMLGKAVVDFDFRNALPGAELHADVGISGFEVIHFFGSGNETAGRNHAGYRYAVKQTQVFFSPSMRIHILPALHASVGASLRLVTNDLDDGRLYLNELRPFGYKQTTLLNVETSVSWDTRDSRAWPSCGFYAMISGKYFPGMLDLKTGFSSTRAEAAGYFSTSFPFPATIAIRGGGQQLSRGYPFFEAAFLGGLASARGYEVNRYAGDAMLYSGLELRMPLTDLQIIFPTEIGLLAFGETGRVFVEGEISERWHPSWGGGIWIAPVDREFTISASIGHSAENTRVDVAAGFAF